MVRKYIVALDGSEPNIQETQVDTILKVRYKPKNYQIIVAPMVPEEVKSSFAEANDCSKDRACRLVHEFDSTLGVGFARFMWRYLNCMYELTSITVADSVGPLYGTLVAPTLSGEVLTNGIVRQIQDYMQSKTTQRRDRVKDVKLSLFALHLGARITRLNPLDARPIN